MSAKTTPPPDGLMVTKLRRDEQGEFWRARISVNGTSLDVDRRWGSWQTDVRRAPRSRQFDRREVLPAIAVVLQQKVRRLERREQREDES